MGGILSLGACAMSKSSKLVPAVKDSVVKSSIGIANANDLPRGGYSIWDRTVKEFADRYPGLEYTELDEKIKEHYHKPVTNPEEIFGMKTRGKP